MNSRVIRDGGVLIVKTYRVWWLLDNLWRFDDYHPDDLTSIFYCSHVCFFTTWFPIRSSVNNPSYYSSGSFFFFALSVSLHWSLRLYWCVGNLGLQVVSSTLFKKKKRALLKKELIVAPSAIQITFRNNRFRTTIQQTNRVSFQTFPYSFCNAQRASHLNTLSLNETERIVDKNLHHEL